MNHKTEHEISVSGELGYGLWDADNHYYETSDCFTRFMPESRKDVAWGGSGGIPVRDTAPRPGALVERLRKLNRGGADDIEMMMEMDPAFMGREARLLLMDAQGLEAAILFPTTGVNWEVTMRDAPIDVLYDNLHAFNLWIQDEWGFTHKDRIFAPPILNLSDPDRAAAELEWALNQGTRAIHLRANSPGGRGLVDPVFNPFWSRVNEAGVILSFHISLTEYVKVVGPLWGEKDRDGFPTTGFQWVTMHGERAIIDTLANIILYDMFGKYPNIKVLVAEHGSIWVDYLLKAMDKYRGMGAPAPVRRRPSEVFKEHVYVQPYYTENLMGLVDLIGVDHVLFGSDFPHGESIAAPVDFKNGLEADLTPENLRKVMRENLRGLLLDDP